jgi:hypothetical protein
LEGLWEGLAGGLAEQSEEGRERDSMNWAKRVLGLGWLGLGLGLAGWGFMNRFLGGGFDGLK